MTDAELFDRGRASLHLAQVKLGEHDWSLALDYSSAAHCAIQELFNRSRGVSPPKSGETSQEQEKPKV